MSRERAMKKRKETTMAFDIYGNNLQRGHCEIHPYVHEEYPCSICLSENIRTTPDDHRHDSHLEQMSHERDMMEQHINQLQSALAQIREENEKMKELLERCEVVAIMPESLTDDIRLFLTSDNS
jgi:hypothetical protein